MIVMIIVVAVIVSFKQRIFSKLQLNCAIDLQQTCQNRSRREGFKRLCQPWRQIGPDPKHKIGVLQGSGLRGAQTILMGSRARLDDQIRHANSLHDLRHQRMNRRDINGNLRPVRIGGACYENGREAQAKKGSGHGCLNVIL
jgi:hypothetical protein